MMKQKNVKPMLKKKFKVPNDVLATLEKIRIAGHVNMIDRNQVVLIAGSIGEYDATVWLQENMSSWDKILDKLGEYNR